MRILITYGSAYFDDWACSLMLCCNEFLLVILSKLGLLLRAALYSFPMVPIKFCFRFLFLGVGSRNKRKCRSCKGICFGVRNACAKRRYHFVFFTKWVSVRADRNFDGASDFRGTGYQSQTNAGAFSYELVLTCLLEHRNLAYNFSTTSCIIIISPELQKRKSC
jgi:hypothetical protein